MKSFLFCISFILLVTNSFGAGFIPCILIFRDSTSREAFAKIPDMMDYQVKYRDNMNSGKKEISSDDLIEIVFKQDSGNISYQRILTYKNYGNKHVSSDKSWLKVLKTGYMTLYYGFEPASNTPAINMWYCKKAKDSIAYFISMKYSGALVMTFGTGQAFRKNASVYFGDYKELADDISKSKYKFEEIEKVVGLYNDWKGKK